ncbi:MAG: holo-ACP synthase [Thermoanaerobaculum sp.]
MIVGLGLDLVEVSRVAAALSRHGQRFLARVFNPGEVLRPHDPQHVAGLFAAKEAALKALGTGWGRGVGFHHVVVAKDHGGKPRLLLLGPAKSLAETLGVQHMQVSITHERLFAVAVVIFEG